MIEKIVILLLIDVQVSIRLIILAVKGPKILLVNWMQLLLTMDFGL